MNEEEKKWKKKLANEKRKEYRRGFKDGVMQGREELAAELRELVGLGNVSHEDHEHPEYKKNDYDY